MWNFRESCANWNKANEQQHVRFLKAVESAEARAYSERFGQYGGQTVTVGKPRQELYEVWQDFTKFPTFMDNVKNVQRLDGQRSRWSIKGPAGKDVELVTRIVEDVSGEKIACESEEGSDVGTAGVAGVSAGGSSRPKL